MTSPVSSTASNNRAPLAISTVFPDGKTVTQVFAFRLSPVRK
jgi:hypothetical protein